MVGAVCGRIRVRSSRWRSRIRAVVDQLADAVRQDIIRPRIPEEALVRHVWREFSKEADAWATRALAELCDSSKVHDAVP